jgi:hypothetical protein
MRKDCSSKIVSLVSTMSPSLLKGFGKLGREPVAITIALAEIFRPSSSASVVLSEKPARCLTQMPSGIFSIDFSVSATNLSRSLRTRAMTARPSTDVFVSIPNVEALRALNAACAAAIRSFEGMHPTLARRPGEAVVDQQGVGSRLPRGTLRGQGRRAGTNDRDIAGQIVHSMSFRRDVISARRAPWPSTDRKRPRSRSSNGHRPKRAASARATG